MRVTRLCIVASLVVVAAVVPSLVALKPSAAADGGRVSLEALLKDGRWKYIAQTNGTFVITLTFDGESTVVVASEEEFPGPAEHDPDLRQALLVTRVLELEGLKPPEPLLREMAERNISLAVGRLGLAKDAVWYTSSFWLRTADGKILSTELESAHRISLRARAQLQPFLKH